MRVPRKKLYERLEKDIRERLREDKAQDCCHRVLSEAERIVLGTGEPGDEATVAR